MWLVIMIIHNKTCFLCCSKILEKFYSLFDNTYQKEWNILNQMKLNRKKELLK